MGKSIRFGANGDLEDTGIRIAWNPVAMRKAPDVRTDPASVVGEESFVIYERTF